MKQDSLFERVVNEHQVSWAERHARPTHPDTSHAAAAHMTKHVSRAEADALAVLRRHPGSTACELEHIASVSDGRIRKRLPDLATKNQARKGERRRCSITGRSAYTWLPA